MFRGTAGKGRPMRTFALTLLTLCVATLVGRLPLAAQGRSNILTAEEIDQANVGTAYDAVQALRPRWLQAPRELGRQPQKGLDTRGPGIAVYIGNVSVGDIEYLRTIPTATVLELRWSVRRRQPVQRHRRPVGNPRHAEARGLGRPRRPSCRWKTARRRAPRARAASALTRAPRAPRRGPAVRGSCVHLRAGGALRPRACCARPPRVRAVSVPRAASWTEPAPAVRRSTAAAVAAAPAADRRRAPGGPSPPLFPARTTPHSPRLRPSSPDHLSRSGDPLRPPSSPPRTAAGLRDTGSRAPRRPRG